jgi:hypothetical protein
MEWKGTFTYKMEDDPVFLEFDALKVGVALLPRSLTHQRILSRTLSDVADKVTRHCGRLRYEYEYSIQEGFRSFQIDLNEKIDSVITHIHTTVKAAMQMRDKQEATIASHVESLQARMDQLRNLQTNGKVLQ